MVMFYSLSGPLLQALYGQGLQLPVPPDYPPQRHLHRQHCACLHKPLSGCKIELRCVGALARTGCRWEPRAILCPGHLPLHPFAMGGAACACGWDAAGPPDGATIGPSAIRLHGPLLGWSQGFRRAPEPGRGR